MMIAEISLLAIGAQTCVTHLDTPACTAVQVPSESPGPTHMPTASIEFESALGTKDRSTCRNLEKRMFFDFSRTEMFMFPFENSKIQHAVFFPKYVKYVKYVPGRVIEMKQPELLGCGTAVCF